VRPSIENEDRNSLSFPALGEQVDIEQMPSPSQSYREGTLSVFIWGTMDPDPREAIRRSLGTSLSDLASSIHGATSGVYFLLLSDSLSRDCTFFVDQFSCKKVFYYTRDATVFFTTNIYRFVDRGITQPDVDVATVATFLMYDYVPTSHTFLKDVRSLSPYTTYCLHDGVISGSTAWPFRESSKPVAYDRAVRDTFDSLEGAFLSGSTGVESLVVPLSGGRDSRLLLGFALKHRRHSVSTLTFGQPGTLDFEIGTGLAHELAVENRAYAIDTGFYSDHVVPSTPLVNGLINHFLAPSGFLSRRFTSAQSQAVLSGYIGDLVLGPRTGSIPVLCGQAIRYPAPKQLALDAVLKLLPNARLPLLERLDDLQATLDACCQGDAIPVDDWYYRVRVPAFTAVCLFSELDEGFSFLAPFVNLDFLRLVFSLPHEVRSAPGFYRDLVGVDDYISRLFRFPLKNANGAGYFSARWRNLASTARYAAEAYSHGVRPKQNYANYPRMYPERSLWDKTAESPSLNDLLGLDLDVPIWKKLSYSQKALLLALRLHLDCAGSRYTE
jgi:hypothetical protein